MQRISTIAVLLVVVLCVGYSTTLTSNPRIVIDTPKSTNPLRPIQTYQQAGQAILEESIFSKNKLTIRTEHISKQMSQKFPELRDVEVSLPLMGHRPAIKATAERPALLVASQKGIYVVGESGRVFARTTDIKGSKGAGGLAVPTVQDEADLDIETGKGVLSGQDVTFITTVVKQFEAKNMSIESLTLPALASELHVRVSGQPYAIKFSLLTDPRITSGQYFALKKQLDQKGITPAEYIDSRVEERIYYK